jgi:hypothetical protein
LHLVELMPGVLAGCRRKRAQALEKLS